MTGLNLTPITPSPLSLSSFSEAALTIGGLRAPIFESYFSLTAADIKAAGVTPAVLAPAPGEGMVLIPVGGILVYKFGTAAFPSDNSRFGVGGVGVTQSNIWNQTVNQTMHLGGPEGQGPQTATANTAYTLTTTFAGAAATVEPQDGSSGTGFVVNDTGTLVGAGNDNAAYRVTAVGGGGAITALVITAGGTGYNVGQTAVATPGGSQPGIGSGAFVSILTVNASGVVGDGTAYGKILYAIQPLNAIASEAGPSVIPLFDVTDGSTDVERPSTIEFAGATVEESPAGTALVTVSGGSQPITRQVLDFGGELDDIGAGASAYLHLAEHAGDTLLDLTDPQFPLVLNAGVYAVSVYTANSVPLHENGGWDLWLEMDFNNDDALIKSTWTYPASGPYGSNTLVYYIPAGSGFAVKVSNNDDQTQNFGQGRAFVQRLS